MIFSKQFWPRKEFKNQAMHFVGGLVLSLVCYAVFQSPAVSMWSVACLSTGIEGDQYFKAPGKMKFADCIRDFVFYMLGACAVWVI